MTEDEEVGRWLYLQMLSPSGLSAVRDLLSPLSKWNGCFSQSWMSRPWEKSVMLFPQASQKVS